MLRTIVVTLAAAALVGCSTFDTFQTGCRLLLSESLCEAADVIGGVVDDVTDVAESVGVIEGGEEDED